MLPPEPVSILLLPKDSVDCLVVIGGGTPFGCCDEEDDGCWFGSPSGVICVIDVVCSDVLVGAVTDDAAFVDSGCAGNVFALAVWVGGVICCTGPRIAG